VVHNGKKVEIRIQGDDNNAPDQWTAVLDGTSAWRVSWVLPSAGYVAGPPTHGSTCWRC
jgi:hypothetical protein